MLLTEVRELPPISRVDAVDRGTTAVSSSSLVDDDPEPTDASTPTTVNGMSFIVTVWPTGFCPLNSSEAVSDPRTTTAASVFTSFAVMNRPSLTVRLRTCSHAGVVPVTVVVQLVVDDEPEEVLAAAAAKNPRRVGAAVSSSDAVLAGATALMSGAVVGFCSALASA